jgi:AmmeMemoRadiSam system protein B
MDDPLKYPKLRFPIDLRIERVDTSEILLVSCPLGISPEPLGLIAAVAPIVAHFEGKLSVDQISAQFAHLGVTPKLVDELVHILDRGLFIEGPRFRTAERTVRETFLQATVRPAALAGLSYPADETALRAEIDRWLANGTPGIVQPGREMIGLISPHIDYRRGGVGYGKTYARLAPERHDLYILIGTAHQYSSHLFHLSAKDFASPLGVLACDRPFVTRLAALYGSSRSFADEILHRREHSLELQAPFLRRVQASPAIVPILVGGFHSMVAAGRPPEEYEVYESFVAALVECTAERMRAGGRICFLSGVDMAHVGRAFGDSGALTPEFMEEVARRDRVYLDAIAAHDKRALFAHVAADGDARRICGFPTLYTVLDVLERLGIRYTTDLVDYRQAVDYASDCAVTFAGVGMYTTARISSHP